MAAEGGTSDPATQGQYGWSLAYQRVLDLHVTITRLQEERDASRLYGAGPDWTPPNPSYDPDGQKLMQTMDASVWASEFVQRFGGDEGLMLTWFASAIMVGHDEARRNPSTEEANRVWFRSKYYGSVDAAYAEYLASLTKDTPP